MDHQQRLPLPFVDVVVAVAVEVEGVRGERVFGADGGGKNVGRERSGGRCRGHVECGSEFLRRERPLIDAVPFLDNPQNRVLDRCQAERAQPTNEDRGGHLLQPANEEARVRGARQMIVVHLIGQRGAKSRARIAARQV